MMLNSLFDYLDGNRMTNALIVKETSSMDIQIEQMKNAINTETGYDVQKLERDLRFLEIGNQGEKQILFELKNSHMPMIVFRDLNIEFNDKKAQIDYLVITRNNYYWIECKNLYGDIEINSQGNFIRTVYENGKKKKVGMYSPITQNVRHIQLVKEMRLADGNGFIRKALFNAGFDKYNISLVVLTNPKTVVNMRYAKKEVRDQVIRVDQLIDVIKKREAKEDVSAFNDKTLADLGQYFLSKHHEEEIDYLAKYRVEVPEEVVIDENSPVYQALKKYRLEQSRKENIKAYYIFNNKQLEEIIKLNPKCTEDLLKVSGFNQSRIDKYGEEILKVFKYEVD